LEEFRKITQKDCYYCGEKPFGEAKHPAYNGNYIYNGIDRVNSTKGYINSNIVPCCKICNRAKSNMSYEDFLNWIKKISNNLNIK